MDCSCNLKAVAYMDLPGKTCKFEFHSILDGKIEKTTPKCNLDGEIRNTTVLEKGMLSGRLKTQHGVEKIDHCIKRCCQEPKCNVALMLGKICYSMECTDANACKPKPAPEIVKPQNPVVAYVKRGTITMGR